MSGMNHKYGKCKDGEHELEDEKYVNWDVLRLLKFCYLGGMLGKHDNIGKAVTSRIHTDGENLNNCLVHCAAEYSP